MAGPGDAAGMALSPLTGAMEGLSSSISKLQAVSATATTSLDALTAAISANVARFVQLYNPAAVIRFELAVKDLNAVIGRALMPLLERFTLVIKEIGGAISGLTPAGTQMIAILAAVVVGLTVAGVATGVFFSVMTGAIVGLTVLAGVLGTATAIATGGISLIVGALAGLVTAFGTAAAATAFVSSDFGSLKDTLKSITQGLAGAFDAISVRFNQMMIALKPLTDALGELAEAGLEQFTVGVIALMDVLVLSFELLRPAIMLHVAALRGMAEGLRNVTAFIRGMFGIEMTGRGGSAEGAGVRNVRFGSPEDAWREAMKASFSLGNMAKPDPAQQSATSLGKIEVYVQEIRNVVVNSVRYTQGVAAGVVQSVNPSHVADRLRQQFDGG